MENLVKNQDQENEEQVNLNETEKVEGGFGGSNTCYGIYNCWTNFADEENEDDVAL